MIYLLVNPVVTDMSQRSRRRRPYGKDAPAGVIPEPVTAHGRFLLALETPMAPAKLWLRLNELQVLAADIAHIVHDHERHAQQGQFRRIHPL
jgi:hypothetical protein